MIAPEIPVLFLLISGCAANPQQQGWAQQAADAMAEVVLVLFAIGIILCCCSCCCALLLPKPPAEARPAVPESDPCMNHCHIPVCSCEQHEFSHHCLVHGPGLRRPPSPDLRPASRTGAGPYGGNLLPMPTVFDPATESSDSDLDLAIAASDSSDSDDNPQASPYRESPLSSPTIVISRPESVEIRGHRYKPAARPDVQTAAPVTRPESPAPAAQPAVPPSITASSAVSINMTMSPPPMMGIQQFSPPAGMFERHNFPQPVVQQPQPLPPPPAAPPAASITTFSAATPVPSPSDVTGSGSRPPQSAPGTVVPAVDAVATGEKEKSPPKLTAVTESQKMTTGLAAESNHSPADQAEGPEKAAVPDTEADSGVGGRPADQKESDPQPE